MKTKLTLTEEAVERRCRLDLIPLAIDGRLRVLNSLIKHFREKAKLPPEPDPRQEDLFKGTQSEHEVEG